MFYISEIQKTAPVTCKTVLQNKVYQTLRQLQIPFKRVETDVAITMEDCVQINAKMDMKMVKTLFLCNRQQTNFYLFITRGDKPFRSKSFSSALGVARISFAPEEKMMAMLGTEVGAVTIFSVLMDERHKVQIVLDEEVLKEEWYGCSDGTTTGYMKLQTARITGELLRFTGHIPVVIMV